MSELLSTAVATARTGRSRTSLHYGEQFSAAHKQIHQRTGNEQPVRVLLPQAIPTAHNSTEIGSLKKYLVSIETHFPHHFFPSNRTPLLEVPGRTSPTDSQEGKSRYLGSRSCAFFDRTWCNGCDSRKKQIATPPLHLLQLNGSIGLHQFFRL
jgi:hypothetical protein